MSSLSTDAPIFQLPQRPPLSTVGVGLSAFSTPSPLGDIGQNAEYVVPPLSLDAPVFQPAIQPLQSAHGLSTLATSMLPSQLQPQSLIAPQSQASTIQPPIQPAFMGSAPSQHQSPAVSPFLTPTLNHTQSSLTPSSPFPSLPPQQQSMDTPTAMPNPPINDNQLVTYLQQQILEQQLKLQQLQQLLYQQPLQSLQPIQPIQSIPSTQSIQPPQSPQPLLPDVVQESEDESHILQLRERLQQLSQHQPQQVSSPPISNLSPLSTPPLTQMNYSQLSGAQFVSPVAPTPQYTPSLFSPPQPQFYSSLFQPSVFSPNPPTYSPSLGQTHYSPTPPPATSSPDILCKVCQQQALGAIFLPCGHAVCCWSCGSQAKICVSCRAVVTQVIRLPTGI